MIKQIVVCFVAVYFAALILTLSQQMTSDRIHLYHTANETHPGEKNTHTHTHKTYTVGKISI